MGFNLVFKGLIKYKPEPEVDITAKTISFHCSFLGVLPPELSAGWSDQSCPLKTEYRVMLDTVDEFSLLRREGWERERMMQPVDKFKCTRHSIANLSHSTHCYLRCEQTKTSH